MLGVLRERNKADYKPWNAAVRIEFITTMMMKNLSFW